MHLINLIISKYVHLYKSRSFGSLLVWSIQVCVNTMPRRKDISNNLREETVAAHQSGKGYKTISKLFGVHHSAERKIIHKWKIFKTAVNPPRSGCPNKFIQGSDRAILRKSTKKPRATSQTLQALVSILNDKVPESMSEKD